MNPNPDQPQAAAVTITGLEEYETRALRHSIFPFEPALVFAREPDGTNLVRTPLYPYLKLGAVLEKVGKSLRDRHPVNRDDLLLELGDVLWYVAAIARGLQSSLEEVASLNVRKLDDRAARNTLSGSGDHR